jgi:hypothetical protein
MVSEHTNRVRKHENCWEHWEEEECEWWQEYASAEEFFDSYPERNGTVRNEQGRLVPNGTGDYWFPNLQYEHNSADCPDVAGGCVDVVSPDQPKTHKDELDWENMEWALGYSSQNLDGRMLVYTGSYIVFD